MEEKSTTTSVLEEPHFSLPSSFLHLTRMFLLFQFDLGLLAAHFAVLVQLAEVRFLGFQNAHGSGASIALAAKAGVDGFLSSWHGADCTRR